MLKNELIFNFYLYFCDMNKLRFHILTLFLLWIVHYQVLAQGRWRHIDGLPCEETTTVVQDSDGYIWIGSRLGLVRYDGYQIKLYRNDMSHPHLSAHATSRLYHAIVMDTFMLVLFSASIYCLSVPIESMHYISHQAIISTPCSTALMVNYGSVQEMDFML